VLLTSTTTTTTTTTICIKLSVVFNVFLNAPLNYLLKSIINNNHIKMSSITPIIVNVPAHQQRRCAFCKEHGHDKIHCNDPQILRRKRTILNHIEISITNRTTEIDILCLKTIFSQRMHKLDLDIAIQHYKQLIPVIPFPIHVGRKEYMINTLVSLVLLVRRIENTITVRSESRERHRIERQQQQQQQQQHPQYRHHEIIALPPQQIDAYTTPPRTIQTPTFRQIHRIMPRSLQTPTERLSEIYNANARQNTSPQLRPPAQKPNVHKTEKKCSESDCAICYENIHDDNYVYLNCNHEFCKSCIVTLISKPIGNVCPLCRAEIKEIYAQNPVVTYSL
jgi:hypothetical protein